jgi:hypothetical protein
MTERYDIPVDDAPEIFTALQEQLGLKLEPEKSAVPVFVIEQIERPSENGYGDSAYRYHLGRDVWLISSPVTSSFSSQRALSAGSMFSDRRFSRGDGRERAT